MRTGVGAPNGPRATPFDRWFRYPAGFDNSTLEQCFDAITLHKGALVVDPFAGVCTAGVRACNLGLSFLGIEAHLLIAELAALKFNRPPDPEHLISHAQELVSNITNNSSEANEEHM